MNIEILVDGKSLVKLDLNENLIAELLMVGSRHDSSPSYKSTPCSFSQISEFFTRIDPKSVEFLKRIGASEDGSVTWREMRKIFEIKKEDDWAAYSGSFGRGITRAYRKITDNKIAKLVWWNEQDWDDEEDWDSDACCVYVDGPALAALRAAIAA